MKPTLRTEDMRSYLAASPWRRRPETWRGATLWDHPGGGTALVPPHDDFDDAAERANDLLRILSTVENRPPEEIARDIASPMVDTQAYRVLPPGLPSGELNLLHGSAVFTAVTDLYAYSARAVDIGHRPAYHGKRSKEITARLSGIRLATPTAGSYTVNVRVPVTPSQPGAGNNTADGERPVVAQLNRAIRAIHIATRRIADSGDVTTFDTTVTDGASANLCEALAKLSIENTSFDVRFRWARGVPGPRSPETIRFPEHAGDILKEGAKRLEQLSTRGNATLTGTISELIHRPATNDRWRIKISGELQQEGYEGTETDTLWAQLTAPDYQIAAAAHIEERQVRVRGRYETVGKRRQITVPTGGVEVL